MNKTFIILISLFFIFISSYSQEASIPVKYYDKASGLYGFKDSTGTVVISPKYQEVREFREGFASVKLNEKWGFINSYGNEITDFIFDTHYDDKDYANYYFQDGLALVEVNRREGFIDTLGNIVIPLIYNNVERFENGLAIAEINNKQGFIDRLGKLVIPFIYDDLKQFENGTAKAELDDFRFYINMEGKITAIIDKNVMKYVKGDLLLWSVLFENGKFGFKKRKDEIIAPPKYDLFKYFDGTSIYVSSNGKWTKINESGKELFPFEFDDIVKNESDLLFVEQTGKWGLADQAHNLIINCDYDEIKYIDGYFFAKKDGKLNVLYPDGSEVSLSKYFTDKDQFENLFSYSNLKIQSNCIILPKKGKFGLFNLEKRKEIIKCKYESIKMSNFDAFALYKESKWALANTEGELLTLFKYDAEYEDYNFFSDYPSINYLKVKSNGKYGLIDTVGNEVVSPVYDKIDNYISNLDLIKVKRGKKWGYINIKGDIIIPIKYDYIDDQYYHPQFIRIQNNDKWGYVKKDGVEIIPPKYNTLMKYKDGTSIFMMNGEKGVVEQNGNVLFEKDIPDLLIPFCEKDLWGYCDADKNSIISPRFYNAFPFDGNIAKYTNGGNYGLINRLGVVVQTPTYEEVSEFIDGQAIAKKNREEKHIIDQTGMVIKKEKIKRSGSGIFIQSKYGNLWNFHEGLTRIKHEGKYGFANTEAKLVIPAVYENAFQFQEGRALVKRNGKFGFIDTLGKTVIEMKYDTAYAFKNGTAPAKFEGKFGYIDKDGNVFIDYKYEDATYFDLGYAKILTDNKYTCINREGKEYYFKDIYDTIVVENIKQLIENMASNRCIMIKPGIYQMYGSEGFGDRNTESYDLFKRIDCSHTPVVSFSEGPGLMIKNVHNLRLVGKSENPEDIKIMNDDDTDYIFTFKKCGNITLENMEIGHDPAVGGPCVAGVVYLSDCLNLNVLNSILYGCGREAFTGNVTNLNCKKSIIKECSEGIFDLTGQTLRFENCQFFDNKSAYAFIYIGGKTKCIMDNCILKNNKSYKSDEAELFFVLSDSGELILNNCSLINNGGKSLTDKNINIQLNNIKAEKNTFLIK